MKASVNKDVCMGCGACAATCDAVFAMDEDGLATVKVAEVPEEAKDAAVEAKEGCPTSAISVE